MSGDQDTPSPKAVRLSLPMRLMLLLPAGACIAAAWLILIAREDSLPDFLLGVAAIGALLCLLLAIIGRLPSGFQVGGLEMHFENDDLADLIGTIKSSLTDNPDAQKVILAKIEKATGRSAFRSASNREEVRDLEEEDLPTAVEEEGTVQDVPAERAAAAKRSSVRIMEVLEGLAENGEVKTDFDVPNSGRGKPPRFDYFVNVEGPGRTGMQGIVVEYERYWNNTTVDLVSRKAARALSKTTPVDWAFVVVPSDGVSAFNRMGYESDRLRVVALPDFSGDKVRAVIAGV